VTETFVEGTLINFCAIIHFINSITEANLPFTLFKKAAPLKTVVKLLI